MHPSPVKMRHLHIQIEDASWQKLKRKHPEYGEVTKVINNLLRAYLKSEAVDLSKPLG
jgi:hypothetical protein